jgi:hypothetical protein
MTAWVPRPSATITVYGVSPGFFSSDPLGRKILKSIRPEPRIDVDHFLHTCWWVVADKQSTSCQVPPPRATCAHGFTASTWGENQAGKT